MKILQKIEEIAYALEPARNGTFFHVAAIFHKNKILSIGQNSFKTHPLAKKFGHRNSSIHAELSSIVRFGVEDCEGLSMAVLRIGRNGKLNLSRPCRCCQNLIQQVDIKNVYYTGGSGKWELLK